MAQRGTRAAERTVTAGPGRADAATAPSQPPILLKQPAPAAPTAADTRTEILTLHDLGVPGPMTMRGASAIQGVLLGIGRDEVVTDARLSLVGAMSPSLIPDASNVTVTLNEQYVGYHSGHGKPS